jgi:hypothetical protein
MDDLMSEYEYLDGLDFESDLRQIGDNDNFLQENFLRSNDKVPPKSFLKVGPIKSFADTIHRLEER